MNLRLELAPAWQIIRHDQRLLGREMHRAEMGWLRAWLPIGVLFSLLQTISLLFVWQLKIPPPPGALTVIWVVLGLVTLSGVMGRALSLLYEKSDLDLLLASPLPARTILLGRLLSIAAAAMLLTGIFVFPLLNALLLRFGPSYLFGWIVWMLLSLATAAIGTAAILTVVRCFGVRRGKLAAQLLMVGCSLTPVIAILAPLLAPESIQSDMKIFFQDLLQHPAWTLAGRATKGEAAALLFLGGVTVLLVAGTAWLLARTFVTGAQQVTERVSTRQLKTHQWTEGLGAVIFRKELRLLVRHPLTISQLLPMVLINLVIGVILIRVSHDPRLLATLVLYWCGVGPITLATFSAAGEVGWDLVRQSSVPPSRVRRLKVIVCLLVSLGPTVPILLWLAFAGHPGLATLTAWVALTCAATTSWLGVTTTQTSPRQDVIAPPRGRALLFQIVAMSLAMLAASGVSLVAFAQVGFGVFTLVVFLLGVLACFTLVDP